MSHMTHQASLDTQRELCEKPVATLPIRAQEECSWLGE